ncbi:hypothetical protein PHYSODRAFT_285700 [Phytophthora sojae]|uniref:RxLR effector protein n=2 Tax=Phytophthora sojae TaxID=67593 RepID=G4ZCD3_PHYSP|nr:hypothetical protein PHYSODRAFT_285700 [Phytophthora sojae]AEK80576.1 Avh53 [Phytophthora sojae]AEK80577.1 Avh53 [Phytophthora sojae]AEK80578.1 Avh53 [Phytophthora sojae]EGZ22161.1 hypothetical protein PHYSODRAFT_285700 [Phytophthora sojae]|eukprot:XP_009524878.1 hypothetical protein PHYSODRAFT_285700 [Phytophthora sojae]
MRLTYILALVIAALSHTSSTEDSKAEITIGYSPIISDLIDTNSARLLRRVETNEVDFNKDEERGFRDVKDAVKKLSPVATVKKTAKQKEKLKEIIKAAKKVEANRVWAMRRVYGANENN